MNRQHPYNLSRPGSSGSVTGAEGSMDPAPPLNNTSNNPMNSEDEDSDGRGGRFLVTKLGGVFFGLWSTLSMVL